MRGVADTYALDLKADTHELASLGYNLGRPGCSVAFYPGTHTQRGLAILSRNYDFTTGAFGGRPVLEEEKPCTSEPYILELHPAEGFSSIALCSYDLLNGVLDGMNEKGLCVALLADDELMAQGMEPRRETAAGLDPVQTLRYLLDTCASAQEARVELLSHRTYYGSIPCHYVVCDASGDGFLFEQSRGRNREFVFDANGEVLLSTNFMRHLHPDEEDHPPESHPSGNFRRYHAMKERIAAASPKLDLEEIKHVNRCVQATSGHVLRETPRGRTLWHSIYVPEKGELQVDFYLGERREPGKPAQIRRSGYRVLKLSESRTSDVPR